MVRYDKESQFLTMLEFMRVFFVCLLLLFWGGDKATLLFISAYLNVFICELINFMDCNINFNSRKIDRHIVKQRYL